MENVRFHITVKGIVVLNNQILLMKRARPSSDGLGYWELPGGGLEYGETPGVLQLNNINFFETLDIALFFCQFFCIFYSYFLVLCDIIVSGGVSYG